MSSLGGGNERGRNENSFHCSRLGYISTLASAPPSGQHSRCLGIGSLQSADDRGKTLMVDFYAGRRVKSRTDHDHSSSGNEARIPLQGT